MKRILLYDPLIIGHHLTYTTNFINWALSRDFEVYFAGHGYKDTFLYRKFGKHDNVIFIEIDFQKDLHVISAGATPTYAELFFSECPVHQYRYVISLQKKYQPDITLFLYGDHMDFAWKDMLDRHTTFDCPTYMIYLFTNTAYYQTREGLSSRLFESIVKNELFEGIFVLDEYQTFYEKEDSSLIFLPDPYKDFSYNPEDLSSYLSESETELLSELDRFLEKDNNPILLIMGWFSQRKNIHWLLELAYKHTGLSFLIMGNRIESRYDDAIDETLDLLAKDGRLFYHSGFVSPYLFDHILRCKRIEFLALPYSCHFGSSALHLLGLDNGLPGLVPDIGLMGTRTIRHKLGLTFFHGDKDDFQARFDDLLHSDKSNYSNHISSFMGNFNKERLFEALDRGFKIKALDKSKIEIDANRYLSNVLKGSNENDDFLFHLHKSLLHAKRMDFEESLHAIEDALSLHPNHSGLLFRKSLILQNSGKHDDSFKYLESIRNRNPGYVELEAYSHELFNYIFYQYDKSAELLKDDYIKYYFRFINFHHDYLDDDNINLYLLFLIGSNKVYLRKAKDQIMKYLENNRFELTLSLVDLVLSRYPDENDLKEIKNDILASQIPFRKNWLLRKWLAVMHNPYAYAKTLFSSDH